MGVKRHLLNEIQKGVAIVNKKGDTEHIFINEETVNMPVGDVTYIFLEEGELKKIKIKESPMLSFTDRDLERLNDDWTFKA